MKAAENQLLPFLEGNKQFIIPIYQRTYSWTREQCVQLWNDIVRTATDETVQGHFIGSIVYIQRGLFQVARIPQLLVIDGQQRLTTLSLLLIALARTAAAATQPLSISAEEIYDSYLTNKHGKDELRYKLLLTQSDKDILIKLVDHPERAETAHDTRSLLLENYHFFEDQIRQSGIDIDILYTGIRKLIVVDIALDKDHDNPQLIFESLNSTGMDLSQADLIRNYVLMGLDNEEQTKLYKDYWYPMEQQFRYADGTSQFDRFMRDYLTLKQGTIPNIDRVYISFKTYQRSRPATSINELVADIYRYAEYFVKMAFARENDREIKQALQDINTLKVDVAYPFFLELYDDYTNRRLAKIDFVAILKLVESYVFRRAICGVPTNALNKVFATLSKEIDKDHYLESVQAAFLQKEGSARFPRDEEFRDELVVKDVYTFSRRHYLFRKLENEGRKEWVNIDEYTIEHIMPQNEHLSIEWQQMLGSEWQNVHETYLHRLGNLTLTGYNLELSDSPFLVKRDHEGGFANSPLRLNQGLRKLERWDAAEIEERGQALADRAVSIWPMPHLFAEQLNKYGKRPQKAPLVEVIGPVDHPLAGFVPDRYKIVQLAENKFHYYRYLNGQWVQYGNGKTPWYALSWNNVGKWLRDFDRRDIKPHGVGGEVHPLYAKTTTAEASPEYGELDETNGKSVYSLDSYPYLQGTILDLFERLRRRILNLDPSVREEYKKLYIAYKTSTNFVDIVPQAKQLRLSLNMKFSEINDPKGLCKDISGVGRWGNGDVEIKLASSEQLDDIMDLIRQSFEKHWEEDDA